MDYTIKEVIYAAGYVIFVAGVVAMVVSAIAKYSADKSRKQVQAGLVDQQIGQMRIANAEAFMKQAQTVGTAFLVVGVIQILLSR